jgi:hypothetical protein
MLRVSGALGLSGLLPRSTAHAICRLSNAVSWVAGKTDDAERKLEISKVAGQILTPA